MKTFILIILFVLFTIQTKADWVQLGDDIYGEVQNDHSGYMISMSSDGSVVAVGTAGSDGNGKDAGYVRVYRYELGKWVKLGENIEAKDEENKSRTAVSLSADGLTLAIGKIFDNQNGYASGSIRIYRFVEESWVQLGQEIIGEKPYLYVGVSVSLNDDGTILALGVPGGGINEDEISHVQVFKLSDNKWIQIGKNIDGKPNDWTGYSVSLSSDGLVVATGQLALGENTGVVRVFKYENESWVQLGENIEALLVGDRTGQTLSISGDGNTLAVGAPLYGEKNTRTGQVRIYSYEDNSWIKKGEFIEGEKNNEWAGNAISINKDGNIVAISTIGIVDVKGEVRIYKYISGDWVQIGSSIEGENIADNWGESIALSDDGSTVSISAPDNSENGFGAGNVRVFKYNPQTSVYEKSGDENINVYPNPTKGIVNIQISDSIIPFKISIVDIEGKQVISKEITNKTKNIDISDLRNGIYFLHIINSKGTLFKKIIKY